MKKSATEWEKVYDTCCGIDVHKKLLVACLNRGTKQEVREFGATTRELLELLDWLMKSGCEMVAMESTGSYWKPLFNILESCNMPAIVVSTRGSVPTEGKKRAIVAVAHSMLVAIYHILKDGTAFQDLGAGYFNQFNRERKINSYLKNSGSLDGKPLPRSFNLPDISLNRTFRDGCRGSLRLFTRNG